MRFTFSDPGASPSYHYYRTGQLLPHPSRKATDTLHFLQGKLRHDFQHSAGSRRIVLQLVKLRAQIVGKWKVACRLCQGVTQRFTFFAYRLVSVADNHE